MADRLEAIRARLVKLQREADILERAASERVKTAAKVIAKYDLSPADFDAAFRLNRRDSQKGHRRSPIAGRHIAPKYRDRAGNTWTGRGRTPLWLVAAEKAGKSRDSFLIDRNAKRAGRKASA